MTFGERLAELRKKAGLSQYELAKRLNFSRGQIANYEHGSREPDYEILRKFADFFGVTTDYLLGRIDNPQNATSSIHTLSTSTFSKRLRSLREQRCMAIEELAEHVKVTPSYLRKLETNPSKFPGISTLHRLAEALGVTAAYLVGDVVDPHDEGPLGAWYQPKELVQFLDESEVMFEGKPLDEDDKERIKEVLAAIFRDAKKKNKRKK